MTNEPNDNKPKKKQEDEIPLFPEPRRVKGFFPMYEKMKKFLFGKKKIENNSDIDIKERRKPKL